MDSATVGIPKGDPNYYKIHTKWNMRLTWTGEYLHSGAVVHVGAGHGQRVARLHQHGAGGRQVDVRPTPRWATW